MLNYRRSGSGRPLILQHGFLGGSGYFASQMAALGHAFDVIAPDLPGFAGSRDEPAVETIEALSRAQVDFVDALGVEKFSLLGHSMG
ncbi:MAG: alpha/beta fold hydrolase, partial [Pseudomonadota bacterium]